MHKSPSTEPVREAVQKARTDFSKTFNFSDYKRKIFPDYESELRYDDKQTGTGNAAVCGQEVTIAYESFLTTDTPVGDGATRDHPLIFTIGDGKVLPALEQGVVGMQPGGKRSLIAAASMAYDIPGNTRSDVPATAPVRFEVELLDAKPPLPDLKTTPYRSSNILNGRGPVIRCGQSVRVDVTMWSIDGKELYSTTSKGEQPISFTAGKSEVFLGLEQGVLGIQQDGERLLIVPPSFQKTLTGSKPTVNFPFPKNQTVLVDIVALP